MFKLLPLNLSVLLGLSCLLLVHRQHQLLLLVELPELVAVEVGVVDLRLLLGD